MRLWALALLVACGGAQPSAKSAEASGGACIGFGALDDLRYSLTTSASFGASSDAFYLVDADEDLGALVLAQRSAPAQLQGKLDRLADGMKKRRAALGETFAATEQTYETAEKGIDEAATCIHGGDHVDLRDPSKTKGGQAKVVSRGCEQAVRLWGTAQSADLTSDVSSSSIAAQLAELRLDGERGKVRDRLAKALQQHAAALRKFHAVAVPKTDDPAAGALADLRDEVGAALKTRLQACIEGMPPSERVLGAASEPRTVTVVVRPKWGGDLAALPHDISFGSGFVVRWRDARGRIETRIVTNDHVMAGAFEAEIVLGNHDAEDKDHPTATLLKTSAHDDIAVLRVDPKSEAAFQQGVALRVSPAREQEQVIAAGFPGVGIHPSFQVSKGIVSNAKFGSEATGPSDLGTYIQHTAAIDPGNSGGPLLDGTGRLLGMNTMKIIGRENVGLAIPAPRIQAALDRAEQPSSFDLAHADATCAAVVAALSSAKPTADAMSRFGLALFEAGQQHGTSIEAAAWAERIPKQPDSMVTPVETARIRAFAGLRAAMEQEKGIRPFETCFDVKTASQAGAFTGSFRSRSQTHTLTIEAEHGVLRAVKIE